MRFQFRIHILLPFLLSGTLSAADWPAWRHDAARSAATDEVLPEQIHLLWSRSLGRNHVAWPEDVRLQFDASYEPIIVGNKLIVASARNNTLTAFDTASGERIWKFFTAGPVRLAPFAYRGRVYFGGDDGRFYCLDENTGAELWTLQTAPTERLVMGNERLISVWPVRGGVVIADEKAFFTVGVWPFEGCLLCQVNVDGQPPQLRTRMMEDVSPQGHLAVSAGRVLVPGGRGAVTCFDATTLEPIPLSYSSSRGTTESHVASSGQVFFHGDAVFDFEVNGQLDFRLQRPIADDSVVYGTRTRSIQEEDKEPRTVHEVAAYDLGAVESVDAKDRRGNPIVKYRVPELWAHEFPQREADNDQPPRLVLKTSNQLLGVRGKQVFALNATQAAAPAALLWQRNFAAKPINVVAADGKLFVVTVDGTIHCFGSPHQEPRIYTAQQSTFKVANGWSDKAADLLSISSTRRGHCIVLGAGSGGLVEELLRQSELEIVVIDPDAAQVQSLRSRLDELGLYGTRATVIEGHPRQLALPPYFASLIVVENADRFGPVDQLAKTMYRVLRPYGGSMVFELSDQEAVTFQEKVGSAALAGAQVMRSNKLTKLQRAGALPGAADWTHEYGDSSNTLMSQDELVKAPFGVLWFGGPSAHGDLYFNRHFWGPGLTVVEGRMVVQGPNSLTSIDIYTGELLWKKELRQGSGPGRRGTFFDRENPGFHFVATPEAVYLVYPEVCLVLDSETGETRSELRLPDPEDQWGKIRVWKDQLLTTIFRKTPQGLLPKAIYAVNRHSGEVKWRQEARATMPLMAVGGDRVYCFDGYLQGFYDAWKRRGLTPESQGYRSLRSFDAATGAENWQRSADRVATWMAYSPEHDILVVSNKLGMDAIQAQDGNGLWKKQNEAPGFGGHPENVWDKVIISGSQIIDQRGPGKSYDIKTGKPILHLNPISLEQEEWEFTKTGHHCNYAIASPHLLTFRAGNAGFFDRSTNTTGRLTGFRSGCRNSLIPAGGVLNAPNYAHGCSCNYNLFTSLALIHMPEADLWTYSAYQNPKTSIEKLGINLGAPGDRIDDDGTLWLEYPAKSDPSPKVVVETEGDVKPFRVHSDQVTGPSHWIGGSGVEDIRKLQITMPKGDSGDQIYNVRLYFLEPSASTPGSRRFDVKVQDVLVIEDLDVFKEAGGRRRVIVKEIRDVRTAGSLSVELVASVGKTLLCGIHIALSENR